MKCECKGKYTCYMHVPRYSVNKAIRLGRIYGADIEIAQKRLKDWEAPLEGPLNEQGWPAKGLSLKIQV